MIDLRSDTVTRPCQGMRKAMYHAEVGDDVFGEDPTVNRLQRTFASLLGKEAALFVPSGMMGNQLGLYVQTRPGDEVLVERASHIFNYESGAAGAISGVVLNPLQGAGGLLTVDQVTAAIRHGYYWESRTRLLCLENTINAAGGVLYPLERTLALTRAARAAGLSCHLDGARLWNATAATAIDEKTYAAPFDTVTCCLSKGLGAPVGSVFAASEALITEAHRVRKLLGGGMRQAGILAAAGLYALACHRKDLPEDHAKARRLAAGLANLAGIEVRQPDTNIVIFELEQVAALPFLESLRALDVAMVPFGPHTIRATAHRDVSMTDMDRALLAVRRVLSPAVAVS